MSSPIAEYGRSARLNHSDPASYSSGFTHTVDVSLPNSRVNIHAGISATQANTQGPHGAACGVMRFRRPNGQVIDFGPNSDNWRPLVYDDANLFTLGYWCLRGSMQGWMFAQVWR